MIENIKKHFPNATSIQPICKDPDGLFSFYRVFVPDEEDPEYEQEYIVISDENDRVIFTASVLHDSEGTELFPDFSKTFYLEKLKDIVLQIEEKITSTLSKFSKKKQIIFDPDYTLYLDVYPEKNLYMLLYYEKGTGKKGSQILFRTTNREIGELLEKLLEIRKRAFCQCRKTPLFSETFSIF